MFKRFIVIILLEIGICINKIDAQEWYIPKTQPILEKGIKEVGYRIQLLTNNDGLLDTLGVDNVFYFRFSPIKRWELYTETRFSYLKKEDIQNFSYVEKSGSGIGDIFSQITYETFSGEDWKIMSNLDITFPTGKNPYEHSISFGSGHFSLALGGTAMKIIDPVILFAYLGYQDTFKRGFNKKDIKPGNSFRFRIGSGISLNPRLQTNFNISGDLISKTKINNQYVAGSASTLIRFGWGIDWTISQKWRVSIDANFGMTKNTTDAILSTGIAMNF
jgi:hypothetical protein